MKCLITQLKGVANNPFLPKLNEAAIDEIVFEDKASLLKMILETRVSGSKIRVAGDGVYLTVEGVQGTYTEYEIPVQANSIDVSVYNPNMSKYSVFIGSKNRLKNFRFPTANNVDIPLSIFKDFTTLERVGRFNFSSNGGNCKYVGDLGEIKHLTELRYIGLSGGFDSEPTLEGNLSSISNWSNTIQANLCYSNLYGDISNFSKCIGLTLLNLADTSVSGTLEGLCQAMVNNGRVSGTLILGIQRTNATYQGVDPGVNKTITFTADGYTVS